MKNGIKKIIPVAWLVTALAFVMGCGKDGVTIGNSAVSSSSGAVRMAASSIEEFKFCVSRVRLETEEEKNASDASSTEEDDNDGKAIEFNPGLIDLSSGAAADWGQLVIPEKAKVVRIKIKVKKNEALCGTNYSLIYNGLSTPRDIEFRWKFDPAIDVDGTTSALRLSFQEIVAALQTSAMSDELQLKDRTEAVEGSALKE
jgi:hypothetical protein